MGYLDSSGLSKQVQYIKAFVNDRIETNFNELGTAAYENTSSFAPANHEHNHATSANTAEIANSLAVSRTIDGVYFNGSSKIVHYGTCSTAAATAAKTVSCTGFTLVEGAGSRIIVKFTKTNTAANPTLNVNSTGAKTIQYRGSAITAGVLAANRTYEFVYDGTNYQLVGDLSQDPTIKQDAITGLTTNRFGTCSTAAATAAKTVSITSGTPTLETGLRVTVKFSNANTASTPTLNVNSLGAKNIFHKGAQITTGDNKSLLTGTCDFVYDGTQWHLVGNYIDTNTDTKVNVTLGATTKAYLLGTSTTPTSTATGVTAIADNNVYLTTTSGQLHATSLETAGNVIVGGTANTNYLQLPSGIKLY